jgi:hypothetical protein
VIFDDCHEALDCFFPKLSLDAALLSELHNIIRLIELIALQIVEDELLVGLFNN